MTAAAAPATSIDNLKVQDTLFRQARPIIANAIELETGQKPREAIVQYKLAAEILAKALAINFTQRELEAAQHRHAQMVSFQTNVQERIQILEQQEAQKSSWVSRLSSWFSPLDDNNNSNSTSPAQQQTQQVSPSPSQQQQQQLPVQQPPKSLINNNSNNNKAKSANNTTSNNNNANNNNNNNNNKKPLTVPGVEPKLLTQILDDVVDKGSTKTFDDVAGLETAKRTLREAVILPCLNPDLFTGLRAPAKGMLLFGPPGNGKTLLAKATACEAKCTFFNISASSLTSKNYGEAEKLVRGLFALARHLQPSIIFIDEIDSILTSRSSGEHDASRRLKTELLIAMDGVGTDPNDRVLVMGATNRPFDLDEAVLRRLSHRVFVPLPEPATRRQILENLLKTERHSLKPNEMQQLVEATNGMSGSDITSLCKEAAMGPLRGVPTEKLKDTRADQLRPVDLNDFKGALKTIRPSVSQECLAELKEWDEKMGSK